MRAFIRRALSNLVEAASLPFSPVGRRRIWPSLVIRLWPVLFPIAHLYRRTLIRKTQVIAVIGSLGKTTSSVAVAKALNLPISGLVGWNGRGFLALALLRTWRSRTHVVIEVGISRKGRMRRYQRLLKPDAVVIASIATEHHLTLGSIEDIRSEKAEMVRGLPQSAAVVVNGDDINAVWMADQTKARVITYGFGSLNDYCATDYQTEGLFGSRMAVAIGKQQLEIKSQLVGREMAYPLLAAIAIGCEAGVEAQLIADRLEELRPVRRRLAPHKLQCGAWCLMDDYKSVYETVFPAFDALRDTNATQRIAILGEVFESPYGEEETYSAIGEEAAEIVDTLIFLGSRNRYEFVLQGAISAGLAESRVLDADNSVHRACVLVFRKLKPNDVVLLKGFGYQRLERITLLLDGVDVSCARELCKMPFTVSCKTCPLLAQS